MPILPPFARLPGTLARRLLVGGRGPGLAAARDAAFQAGPQWDGLADALALAVWEDAPLCVEAATVLAGRHGLRPFLPPAIVRAVATVAKSAGPANPEPYYQRLAARRESAKMFAYLLERQRKTPGDCGILHRLAAIAPMTAEEGCLARAETVFAALSGAFFPLGALVAGELALLDGDAVAAEAHFRRALEQAPLVSARLGLAEALLRQGGQDAAIAELAAACRSRPFDTLALSRLHDVATGLADRRTPLPGSVAVLVYSYNNAALLDRTLAALAATEWRLAAGPGGGHLFVLDNGSADATGVVLTGWRERLGERLSVISLPVNVGAPAARNWLAAMPEVRATDFTAYLDDDASVPPDWLGRFGAAVEALPEAGVWGCSIRGQGAPRYVQSGDTHLFPLPRSDNGFGRAFEPARPWLATPDCGQYAVCRPCASVTGCCHLFRTEVLAALGGFDIRFSPSQYDDLDHDLRLLLAGRVPVFQGHLAVTHAKATGSAGNPGGASYGSGFANQFKLHHKYDDAAIVRATDTAFAALAEDIARKVAVLADLGLIDAQETAEGGHGR